LPPLREEGAKSTERRTGRLRPAYKISANDHENMRGKIIINRKNLMKKTSIQYMTSMGNVLSETSGAENIRFMVFFPGKAKNST